jgi:hypothetical protein
VVLLLIADWCLPTPPAMFGKQLVIAMDLAELLLKQRRFPEAYKHLSAVLDRIPAGTVSPDHKRALKKYLMLQLRCIDDEDSRYAPADDKPTLEHNPCKDKGDSVAALFSNGTPSRMLS